jgi:hypothetical protein
MIRAARPGVKRPGSRANRPLREGTDETDVLAALDREAVIAPSLSRLKGKQAEMSNSTQRHVLYFGNLDGDGLSDVGLDLVRLFPLFRKYN